MYHFIAYWCFWGWLFLFGGLLVGTVDVMAQKGRAFDTTAVVQKIAHVPRQKTQKPSVLAYYLTKECPDDYQKVLVISYWIAQNIKYNYRAFKNRIVDQKTSVDVLRKRKALSKEYAQLFKDMCTSVGIQAEIVNGYTKSFDFVETDTLYRAEHTWSIVEIDNRWYLMDLTYGSGHIAHKKQGLPKLMARAFGIKYRPKFKHVHQFNPQWFFVPPDEMIFTHFPNLEMYQLLKMPLSLKLFKQGGWVIHGHLSWYYKTLKESPEIDAYGARSQIQKWLKEGEEGHQINPDNCRVKGMNYYLALDSLFRAFFDSKDNCLNVSLKELEQLEGYIVVVDSFLREGITNNNREFESKQLQSLQWEKQLNKQNKVHIDLLQKQIQKNLSAQQLIQQIKRENLWHRHSAAQWIKRRSLPCDSDATIVKQETEMGELLEPIDSLEVIAKEVGHQKDVLMAQLQTEKLRMSELKEIEILNVYEKNSETIKRLIRQKKLRLPLVYENKVFEDRQQLVEKCQQADSLNQAVVYTALLALRKKQLASHQNIKVYCCLAKLLKEAQHKPFGNRKEWKQRCRRIAENLNNELRLYQLSLQKHLGFQQKWRRLLSKEINCMRQAKQYLTYDLTLEAYRHQTYRNYRASIRQAENIKLQAILREVAKIKVLINQEKCLLMED